MVTVRVRKDMVIVGICISIRIHKINIIILLPLIFICLLLLPGLVLIIPRLELPQDVWLEVDFLDVRGALLILT